MIRVYLLHDDAIGADDEDEYVYMIRVYLLRI
jgi:hypothetical protein